ncbi:MAG: M3 family metallopeptidase [Acidobacteria bacterium]|nr:M3 family metallopeptidase [Acidobacteriota bacterium]
MNLRILSSSALTMLVAAQCVTAPTQPEPAPTIENQTEEAPITTPTETNPLLREWTGPYGGVPPFDEVEVRHFKPALEAGMLENLREIEAIVANPAPPTFENTIAALERAGRVLDRVGTAYGIWSSTMSMPEFQAIEREMAPRLAEFNDRITQNRELFERIEAVYESPSKASFTPEQQRLAWLYHNNFVRAGANLDEAEKERVAEINQELASLYTKFSQNVLADETDLYVVLDDESDLAGLPESLRRSAAAAAEAKGHPGKWVITNTRSSMQPFLTYSDRRDLREKVWRNFVNRGDLGGETDNNAIIRRILQLRAERAKLRGYETHAHWRLENQMAKTPERAMELLEAVWTPAVARVHEEVADMEALARREGTPIDIEPWDYRYWMEKVRKERYDLDENEIKPYMQLEKLREAMFWVAGELYDFGFRPAPDVPVYHPDVRVWEVYDQSSGNHLGLWYFDPYAREGKRSGAWMNTYRTQEKFEEEVTTILSNNANFVKGSPGEPVLISWDDAETLFHEFGHALHGLASSVHYPSLAGTRVSRDYVEFPSQLMEHWLSTPEVLQRFAVHYETGEPIPQDLVERIERAATFNEGFATTEYLASALVDMKLHLAGDRDIDPDEFERRTLEEIGMPDEIVMRHRTPQFLHVFAGDSYSAGYYSYLWADTLTADAYEAFEEGEGPYDPVVAERLRRNILAVGNSIDPAEAYRAFRGRDARIEALMEKRGFPIAGAASTPRPVRTATPARRVSTKD